MTHKEAQKAIFKLDVLRKEEIFRHEAAVRKLNMMAENLQAECPHEEVFTVYELYFCETCRRMLGAEKPSFAKKVIGNFK